MSPHVCPGWGGYFIDNRFRRLLHKPEKILAPYVQQGMTVHRGWPSGRHMPQPNHQSSARPRKVL